MTFPLGISTNFIPMLLVSSLGGCALEVLAQPPRQSDTTRIHLQIAWNMIYVFVLNWLNNIGYLETGSAE
jgi:hypothetical protein